MNEYPILSTKRLRLDRVIWTDIPKIIEYAGNKAIADATGTIPYPYQASHAIWSINNANECFDNGSGYVFAIRTKIDAAFIGRLSLRILQKHNRAEMGYWLGTPFWGQGFATEAVSRLLQFAFDTLSLNKVSAFYLVQMRQVKK